MVQFNIDSVIIDYGAIRYESENYNETNVGINYLIYIFHYLHLISD